MWKEYSAGYLKNNKASGISIMAAALISTLLLSLLCSLFYNIWQDEIQGIVLKEGGWQGRITGELNETDLIVIQSFANVERAVRNEELSGENTVTVDITFKNPKTIYHDMPMIVKKLGLTEDAGGYHELLLSRYLIHDPEDENPPLLMTFYLAILLIVALSLVLIIHNSFAVSMNARLHQFGIFSSVGAAPGQILACLMQEAAALCGVPVLLGSILGVGACYGVICGADRLAWKLAGAHEVRFGYHPAVFTVTIFLSAFTVLLSAWIPAGRLSRLTPLEAIRSTGEQQLKLKKRSFFLPWLFGIEGELAGTALKAQKKALRTSTLSLTLSFLGFMIMLCFFTLSEISTNHTYFEKYQDVWDVMAAVKDEKLEEFGLIQEFHSLRGAKDSVVYQKASGTCLIPETKISGQLRALGGLEAVAGTYAGAEDGFYRVEAAIVILDDESFAAYCGQIGAEPQTDGAVIYNRIWDSVNSNFRYRRYIPFLQGTLEHISFSKTGKEEETAEIPVAAYAHEAPLLREEYDDYALVQFIPLSLWKKVSGQIGVAEPDLYIRILAEDSTSLDELRALEETLAELLTLGHRAEVENRIEEKLANDEMILGYKVILGGFCCLLAVIGIANIFSNTLGFLRQRRREVARYLSVGMTPAQLKKMFGIEALVIAGRPLLITLPITAAAVSFMIRASYLNPMEFWAQAPAVPAAVFSLLVLAFVALAYYLGGRKVLGCSLADALRDDTMV